MSQASEILRLQAYIERLDTLNKKWQPHDLQKEVMKAIFVDGYKRIFIRGGRKSAKTEIVNYICHRIAATGDSKICSVIGPTLKQQKKIIWNNRRLQDFAPLEWGGNPRLGDVMIRFPWESFIEVDGSENAEAHRGEEQDLLVLDELKDHEHDAYDAMYPNLAARDGILIVIGTPPKHKKNIYYELEQEAHRNPEWKFFHWRIWDNPHIPREWIEKEKAAYYARGEGHKWEIEYEARYVFGGKDAVFSMLDQEKHIVPQEDILQQLEKDARKFDYFILSDPGNRVCHANLFIAYDRYNNMVYVLDEIYETEQANTATNNLVPRILAKAEELFPSGYTPYWIYDEAALWFETEVTSQFPHAPPMTPTNKAAKNKETGIGVIKFLLSEERLYISSSCEVGLVEEMFSYYTDKNGDYPKVDDHAIDGLRYFVDYVGITFDREVEPKATPSPKGEALLQKLPRTSEDAYDMLEDEELDLWN